ncbi:glycosyltransferase [Sphingomonas paucimobilis]|uniref:Glycosyltransferase n=2 Tax=Sphingomonas TaxID=13687 RepID=A0A7Y2KM90_SPHPI|nr:glycosyltransferase [Sphingomonas paucimobilis]EPE62577.1 glycosyl transferases group 1 family protein [Exiguobacterium sp. S17]MCM3681447.1 glycosyltransferase [Sphingomonas paucimobilis]NNG56522.1 glycosyltransferase [Sphingomonas paucimobilis]
MGIELSSASMTYAWDASGEGLYFERHTLFGSKPAETLSALRVARALVYEITRPNVKAVYIAGYERPSHFITALVARAFGRRVIVMLDSKYDDKPRRTILEAVKRLMMVPYSGGFAAGRRSADYLRLLGLGRRPITLGYDTVSIHRIRALASDIQPKPWSERPFLAVARYVTKKNLAFLLKAYARFRDIDPASQRRLILCGGGPLENQLRDTAQQFGVSDWVDFTGFVPQADVARHLAGALCLLLPSVEEQWGLVVNEALAFSLPLILAENVGAIDLLAAQDQNAFILEANDRDGWAKAMASLGSNQSLWSRMVSHSASLAPLGDVSEFVRGVFPHLPFPLN